MKPAGAFTRLFAACALAALSVASARGGTLEWDSRLSGAVGTYVYDRTTSETWWSNGLAWTAGPWTVRALLPVVLHDTPLLTFGLGGPVPTGTPHRDSSLTASHGKGGPPLSTEGISQEWKLGLGDPVLAASVEPRADRWSSLLGAGVKFPDVASEGFGTGEWDGWLVAGLGRELGTELELDGSLARTWYGDPPGQEILDTWSGLLRLTRDAGLGSSLSLYVSLTGSTVRDYRAPASVGVSGESRLARGSRLGWLAEFGLNDTAADLRASLRYSVRLAGR